MAITIDPTESRHFIRFAISHKDSGDIDPAYPLLKKVHEMRKILRTDKAVWHTLVYLAWYHLGSAEKAYSDSMTYTGNPTPERIGVREGWIFPTGVERRGFRGILGAQKAVEMLNYMLRHCSPLSQWLREITSEGGENGWSTLYEYMKSTLHNGAWAAYKWCDLAKNVLDCDITAPNIGVGGGGETAGPIAELVRLTHQSWARCAQDFAMQREVFEYFRAYGVPWVGIEEMETALCDYNSLCHRHYYVGHDIDKQQEDLTRGIVPEIYWYARRECFHPRFLGEANDWSGVRKDRTGFIENVDVASLCGSYQ